jgi:hypothetical protein
MKTVIAAWREADARAFNDSIADLYRGPKRRVAVRVKKIKGLKIERERGHQISDIDVLVLDEKLRRILVIETKAVAPGRTPRELSNERDSMFIGRGGKRSEVEKLADATQWVKNHRPEILEHFGIKVAKPNKWFVKPLMVVESELLTPFIASVSIQVVTVHELRAQLARTATHGFATVTRRDD